MASGEIELILIPNSIVYKNHAQSHKSGQTHKFKINMSVSLQSNSHPYVYKWWVKHISKRAQGKTLNPHHPSFINRGHLYKKRVLGLWKILFILERKTYYLLLSSLFNQNQTLIWVSKCLSQVLTPPKSSPTDRYKFSMRY